MKKNNVLKYLVFTFFCILILSQNVFAAQMSCNSLGDFKTDLQNLFNLLKILVPLLVIGLSIYDFIKAVTAKDSKDLKEAFRRMLKRFIYAIILFFLPVILNLVLDILVTNSDVCIN